MVEMALHGGATKMSGAVQSGIKNASSNSLPICFEKAWTIPFTWGTLRHVLQEQGLEFALRNPFKIQIGDTEIHDEAWSATFRIAMRCEHLVNSGDVVGSFERVVVVRVLAQRETRSLKLIPALAVAHTHSAPIVALQED
jgi:hypothetical protein